jgi:hypothetical protein
MMCKLYTGQQQIKMDGSGLHAVSEYLTVRLKSDNSDIKQSYNDQSD